MKEGLSGSIVNEMEVNERWSDQRELAIQIIGKLKTKEPLKMVKDPKRNNTFKSENYDEFMIFIASKRKNEKFKRSE